MRAAHTMRVKALKYSSVHYRSFALPPLSLPTKFAVTTAFSQTDALLKMMYTNNKRVLFTISAVGHILWLGDARVVVMYTGM